MDDNKFTIDGYDLKQALAKLKPAIRRGVLPVLGGVRMTACDGFAMLTTTDLDVQLDVLVDAKALDLCECVVSFHALAKLVAKGQTKTKADPVTFDVSKDGYVGLAVGDTTTSEYVDLDVSEWPKDSFKAGSEMSLDLDAVVEVLPSTSPDDARPILTGVCIEGDVYVATDSYRLAAVTIAKAKKLDEPVLIPRKAVQALGKGIGGVHTVELSRGQRDMRITLPDVTATVRLIEGEFPNWRGLVDPAAKHGPLVTFEGDYMDGIKAYFKSDERPIVLSAKDGGGIEANVKQADDSVVTVAFDGTWHVPDLQHVAYRPEFLHGALDGIDSNVLCGVDALKPALVSAESDGRLHQRLLMPVRV